jgi:ABC-type nitrate/sulfonate/bicarbonate transport system permease component
MFPSAMPFILTGMRVALGFSFMGIVAAELIGAREGIGFLIMNSRQLMNTEQLFVGLLSLGVVGAIIDRLFRSVLDRYTRRYMQFQREV